MTLDRSATDATGGPCGLGPWNASTQVTASFTYLSYDPSERSDRLELFLTGRHHPREHE